MFQHSPQKTWPVMGSHLIGLLTVSISSRAQSPAQAQAACPPTGPLAACGCRLFACVTARRHPVPTATPPSCHSTPASPASLRTRRTMGFDRSRPADNARKSPRPRVALPGNASFTRRRARRKRNRAGASERLRQRAVFNLTISIANRPDGGTCRRSIAFDATDAPLRRRSTSPDLHDRRRSCPPAVRSSAGADRQIVKKLRIIRDVAAQKHTGQRNF